MFLTMLMHVVVQRCKAEGVFLNVGFKLNVLHYATHDGNKADERHYNPSQPREPNVNGDSKRRKGRS
jgi:hypothetical protein